MRDRINAALEDAIRDDDKLKISTLRLINAAIKDKAIAQRAEDEHVSKCVSDDDVLGILAKMVKQRNESARAYEEGGRLELAEKERDEIGVIEEFLPRQLSDDEVAAAISKAIEETGASSIRDMGKVMGMLKASYSGQMDFGRIGPQVKARLV